MKGTGRARVPFLAYELLGKFLVLWPDFEQESFYSFSLRTGQTCPNATRASRAGAALPDVYSSRWW